MTRSITEPLHSLATLRVGYFGAPVWSPGRKFFEKAHFLGASRYATCDMLHLQLPSSLANGAPIAAMTVNCPCHTFPRYFAHFVRRKMSSLDRIQAARYLGKNKMSCIL